MTFLVAKKILAMGTFAFMATTETQLEERLIKPFIDGVTINELECKSTGDPHVLSASV